ncbi:MAG: hypothetical protein KAW12_23985 [Candidatus Aminicenantes bacterium]|nr:hypothetical protein [Candidatus Aminicenantes bacterium]
MKKKVLLVSLAVMVLLTSFCARRWRTNPIFLEKTREHRIIAILPFEMIFTGKKPKKLTHEQVKEIEEAESIAFQHSLYRLLSLQQGKYRHPVRINIQPVEKTNRILADQGIHLRDSWTREPVELAKILGVDAVVKTRIEKRRYMSGLASFGLELGATILNVLSEEFPLGIFIPTATKRIRAHCFLFNGKDGYSLWARNVEDRADWSLSANEIIDGINYHFARHFPYR